ncbi:MAG: flagellar basal body protein FliL [Candidatus Accumulibacter sp.]|nr:flagellar basal body protein FliL [Accumulibacter sp.]
MSKDAKPIEGDAPPKKSKKLLIIVIAAVVLLAGAGGAALFLLSKNGDHGDEDEEVATEKVKPAKKKKGEKAAPPVYVPFESFTVNLVPEQGEQFLQLVVSVEVEDIAAGDTIKLYMPKLRNRVMLLLSDKKASDLITKDGKEKLAQEIRDQMNEVIDPSTKGKKAEAPVKEVLFTSFIIQ